MPRRANPIWLIDPKVHFLNHGSFGATPLPVLEYQHHLRERLERDPVYFFVKGLEDLLNNAREKLGIFIGGKSEELAFVPNATFGVNTILRSLKFKPEDEILITDHSYNACRNAVEFVVQRTGAKVIVATIPFPLDSSRQVFDAVLENVSSKTKLVLLDHVTSSTALIFPVKNIVRELNNQGIDTLIDGAHAPGFIALNLNSLGAAYYTGNCHKWLCAPKGAGFLYVRQDKQSEIRPLAISHGANSPRKDCSLFHLEFDWTGTDDPTPYLCVPKAIDFIGSLLPGGWDALRQHNRQMVLDARNLLCEELDIPFPAPEDMIGSMTSIPLRDTLLSGEALQSILLTQFKIQVPVIPWPDPAHWLLRISAQVYNDFEQYKYLAQVLKKLFKW